MFKFKLEALLKLRAQREEEAKRQLALRLRQIRELKEHLAELAAQAEQLAETLRAKALDGALPAPLYLLYKQYEERLHLDQRRGGQLLERTLKEEEKDRQKLMEANINHRLMIRLKEKQAASFKADEEKKERETLEDLAGRGWLVTQSQTETSAVSAKKIASRS